MGQLIPSAVFMLAVLVLCLLRPNSGRILLEVFFLMMAVGVNVVLVLVAPGLFVVLGTVDALISLYRWFFENVVALAPSPFGARPESFFVGGREGPLELGEEELTRERATGLTPATQVQR